MSLIVQTKPKRKKPIKGKPVRPSKQVEMKARGFLLKLAKKLGEDVDAIRPLFDSPQSAYAALSALLQKYDSALISGLMPFAEEWVSSASAVEKTKLEKQLSDALGVDMTHILDDQGTRDAVLTSQMEAEQLIVSFPRQYLGDVSKAVLDNFQGKPLPEGRSLTQQIQAITGHNKYRARLIARDQTSKMTTALNKSRMQSVGIEEYIWRTSGDQRVVGYPGGYKPNQTHGNHYDRNGKKFRWDSPPEDGAPGEPINCRCIAVPVIDPSKINLS